MRFHLPSPHLLALPFSFIFALTAPHAMGLDNSKIFVEASTQSSPPAITLGWDEQQSGIDIAISRRELGEAGKDSWNLMTTVSHPTQEWSDTSVTPGIHYEYQIHRPFQFTGTTKETAVYLTAGIDLPLTDSRGIMLLAVDETYASSLEAELAQLELDLVADGWGVVRKSFPRDGALLPESLREWVQSQYASDPANIKGLYLFGHLPILMSGSAAPDGHKKVPLPTDTFYADIDGEWTDRSSLENNPPGDGQMDAIKVPGNGVELQTGRVDLSGMTAWTKSEIELLRDYLNKTHRFKRAGIFVPQWGGGDNTPERQLLYPIFGSASIHSADFSGDGLVDTSGNNQPLSFAWVTAFGNYKGSDYADNIHKSMFNQNFGSHKQKWERDNSPMRALLAQPEWGLTCVWGRFPMYFFHHMGTGQPIGYTALRTQNNATEEYFSFVVNETEGGEIWLNLLGDPSLRLHPVIPPGNLQATRSGSVVELTWSPSSDTGLTGYHVYRSTEKTGTYTRLTQEPTTNTIFSDSSSPIGEDVYYQVRAVKNQQIPAGNYINQSLGTFAYLANGSALSNQRPSANALSAASQPGAPVAVNLTGTDPEGDALSFFIHSHPQNGMLRGTPPEVFYVADPGFQGSDSFSYTAFDGINESTPVQVDLSVFPNMEPLAIATSSAGPFEVGKAVVRQLNATGGNPPYTWSIVSGALPAGLSLSSAGLLEGTPSAVFDGVITVKVEDASSIPVQKAVSIQTNAPAGGEQSLIRVKGNGFTIFNNDSSPNALDGSDFGFAEQNQTIQRVFTVENQSYLNPVQIMDVSINGVNSTDFAVIGFSPVVLNPGDDLDLTIEFTPREGVIQDSLAAVEITHNADSISPYTFSLRGRNAKWHKFDGDPFSDQGFQKGVIALGDYDLDGDLDALLSGVRGAGNYDVPTETILYRQNSARSFEPISTEVFASTAEPYVGWADYDNDGDLDFAIVGGTSATNKIAHIYRNDDGSFSEVSAGLDAMFYASLAWGDIDNDGDLDLVTGGSTASGVVEVILYKNEAGTFVKDPNNSFVTEDTSGYGAMDFGDFDGDGDIDLLLVGEHFTQRLAIYRNENGTLQFYTDISPGFWKGDTQWFDFNQDGTLDIVTMGEVNGAPTTAIYLNLPSGFEEQSDTGLTGFHHGGLAVGDYSNNGIADIAVTGFRRSEVFDFQEDAKLYEGSITTYHQTSLLLEEGGKGDIAFGDLDADGDLDIFHMGDTFGILGLKTLGTHFTIYENLIADGGSVNLSPTAPANFQVTEVTESSVTFSWNTATDDTTPVAALSYNIRVGFTSADGAIVSPMADLVTGLRHIPARGPAQTNSWTLKNLPPGQYSASVQAIDAGLAGGAWSDELIFIVGQSPREAWRIDHFGADAEKPELEEPLWGWYANPDSDSLVNLLEYATGGLPNFPDPSQAAWLQAENDFGWKFSTVQRVNDPGLLLSIQYSTTLKNGSWQDASTILEETGRIPLNAAHDEITYSLKPDSPPFESLFLRFNASIEGQD